MLSLDSDAVKRQFNTTANHTTKAAPARTHNHSSDANVVTDNRTSTANRTNYSFVNQLLHTSHQSRENRMLATFQVEASIANKNKNSRIANVRKSDSRFA